MNTITRKTALLFALLGAAGAAHASVPGGLTYGLGLQAGTLGFGPDLNIGVNKNFGFDLGLNAYNYNKNMTQNDIKYNFNVKLNTVHLLANYYPFGGIFHLTAGVVANGNKFSGDAQPSNGSGSNSETYSINGTTYTAQQVGTLHGSIKFPGTAYYAGIGWGLSYSPQSHWGFNFDLGGLYQGKPTVALSSSGGTESNSPTLQKNIAEQQAKTQKDLNNFRWWPVLRIGAYYRF
ncbi:hypothetical protein [Acidihalobacter ferrooxydans]|uniref:Outer membrane protein beta-barrel domain-containing protein n=1 Tax=Acidihalobacter ferrooxydans TaxID=1765967 RepID=A0A1P8UDY6_9GAMM|nr:hypothetical protein [Acidihalobacter ferrooxydans]APZ42016.1 hypothetical protein BW247_01975 [Acidihalobacter ferrooxydans]